MSALPRLTVWMITFTVLTSLTASAGAQASDASVPATSRTAAAGHWMHSTSQRPRAGGTMTGAPQVAPADVASPQAIVSAYYESLSGPAGQKRHGNRFLSLFFPGARLLPAEGKGHSGTMPHIFSPQTYLFDVEPNMMKEGFVATEIAQRGAGVGKIFHVFSTYEVRHAAGDAKPFVRGVNSFQLFFDGRRWWIVGVTWQPETRQLKLPDEYVRCEPGAPKE